MPSTKPTVGASGAGSLATAHVTFSGGAPIVPAGGGNRSYQLKFVPQRGFYDCAIAASAMVFGMEYEAVEDLLPRRCGTQDDGSVYGPTPHELLWLAITRLHLNAVLISPAEFYAEMGWPADNVAGLPDRSALWSWLANRRAILTVPSFSPGIISDHAVAWDGKCLIDPMSYRALYPGFYGADERPLFTFALVILDGAS